MKEIIEIAELRKRFKLELNIMAEFFAVETIKIAILNSENKLKIFSQQNNNFENAVDNINLNENLYKNVLPVKDAELKDILAKYIDDFKTELICFKVVAADYIYIIYFPFNKDEKSHNPKAIKLFQKQLKTVLDDIYRQEEIKNNLSQKNLENKNLKKEKYITASALDSVPGNISILDKNGDIVYTNSSWEKFALKNGALPQNVGVAENYLEVCKKAADKGDLFSTRAYNGILSVLNNEDDNFCMDYPCHSPQEKRWFRMYVSSFKGIGSYEVMILHQDITKEIMAEKKSEEILNKLPAAIMKFDSDKKLVYFNKKAMNFFDLSEDNLGRKFFDLKITDHSNDEFIDKLNYAAENKRRIEFKILIENNGIKKYYSNYLVPEFEADNLKTITSIIPMDILTKDSSTRLDKQRNHYLQLFNNFPDALVLLNIDEKIINANKKFCQLFKYEKEDLKNKKLDDLIVPAGKKGEAEDLSHLVLTGTQLEQNVFRINSRGEKINLKLSAFPVLLNNNKMGVYAVYREL